MPCPSAQQHQPTPPAPTPFTATLPAFTDIPSSSSQDHIDREGGEEESTPHDQHDTYSEEDEEPKLVSASKRQNTQPTLVQSLEEEEVTQELPIALRRSTRQRFPPDHWKNTRVYYNHNAVVHHDQGVCNLTYIPTNHMAFTLSLDKEQIPNTYE